MTLVRLLICSVFALLTIGCATDTYDRQRPMATIEPDKVSIPEYQNFLASLTAALDEGRPRELNAVEQSRFDDVIGRLDRMLDRFESIEDMDQDERVALLNLHADLEEVVMGAADQQVICRRSHTVGSNFKRTTCKTRGEWRSDRERASELMRDIYISSMTAPPGG